MAVDIFHWRWLSGVIEQIKVAPQFLVDKIFKTQEQSLAETIDVDLVIGGKKLAPFVSPVEGGIVVNKLGRELHTVQAPRLRPKKSLNAQDLLTVRAPGANLYVGSGGDIGTYRQDMLSKELADLKNLILRTTEWMAAQALKGTLSVAQDNVAFEIDFKLPAAHKPTLAGVDLWSATATSDPVNDLRTWRRLITRATGFTPDMALLGHEAVDALLAHTKIQNLLDKRNLQIGNLSFGNANYIGRLVGIDLYEYDAQYVDATDTAQDFVDPKVCIMLASNGPFKRHYATIMDLDLDVAAAVPFFSKTWKEKDPSVQWLLAESRPLPVPHWPECIVYATVLA